VAEGRRDMILTPRVIWEQFPASGQPASVRWDTDLQSPPIFEDLVGSLAQELTVGPTATVNVVLSTAACAFLLVSDDAVLVRLLSGETQMRVRMLLVAAEDETGAAVPAQTLVLAGNSSTTANVKVFAMNRVS